MKKIIAVVALFSAVAFAQDRAADILKERNVSVLAVHAVCLPDGGAVLYAQGEGVSEAGRKESINSARFNYNGQRATDLCGASLKAVKLAAGVGDGGLP